MSAAKIALIVLALTGVLLGLLHKQLVRVYHVSSGVGFDEDYGAFFSDINRMGRAIAFDSSINKFVASLKRARPPGTIQPLRQHGYSGPGNGATRNHGRPGGQNLAISPDVWGKMFDVIPSESFGLNYDPSHLVWQHIDPVKAIRQYGSRIVHFHAKDTRIDREALDSVGIMGLGWHTPKLPGLGDIDWGQLFSALSDTGYRGAVCIEVEDRAYEGDLASRKLALTQTKGFLKQFC
jgi:hypothetical protein